MDYNKRYEEKINKKIDVIEAFNPTRVKADYISCRACGSKLNKKHIKKDTLFLIKCPVCKDEWGLYSKTARERIEKAEEAVNKAKKERNKHSLKVSQKSSGQETNAYKEACARVENTLEIIYDVYQGPDFTEYKGETGGDVRQLRVYKDGSVCEK